MIWLPVARVPLCVQDPRTAAKRLHLCARLSTGSCSTGSLRTGVQMRPAQHLTQTPALSGGDSHSHSSAVRSFSRCWHFCWHRTRMQQSQPSSSQRIRRFWQSPAVQRLPGWTAQISVRQGTPNAMITPGMLAAATGQSRDHTHHLRQDPTTTRRCFTKATSSTISSGQGSYLSR